MAGLSSRLSSTILWRGGDWEQLRDVFSSAAALVCDDTLGAPRDRQGVEFAVIRSVCADLMQDLEREAPVATVDALRGRGWSVGWNPRQRGRLRVVPTVFSSAVVAPDGISARVAEVWNDELRFEYLGVTAETFGRSSRSGTVSAANGMDYLTIVIDGDDAKERLARAVSYARDEGRRIGLRSEVR